MSLLYLSFLSDSLIVEISFIACEKFRNMNNPFKGTLTMKLHTLDEMTDRYIGPVGTPERDEYERML